MAFQHISVLLNESLKFMDPRPGEIFVDGTLGGAGHSLAFLGNLLPGGTLIGIDQDLTALKNAEEKLKEYKENVILVHDNFQNIGEIINSRFPEGVDGIFLDIGVSSPQIDTPERGFSYMHDAPLDMRMNQEEKTDAKYIINNYSLDELHRIIKKYGEENWAKRIAEFIVEKRKEKQIETTGELVKIIEAAIPKAAREKGSHPAKRTFQALRIEVNKELEVLEKVIDDSVKVLKSGGRLGIITFHSLEDRIVKDKFNYFEKDCICPSEFPICNCDKKREVKILTKKPVVPSEEETSHNPRAKSAKLRVLKKI
jgi:16S rRNA (cytosine1402-N4)-methyltransferase